ncbi:1489_t:CDS:1 [Diversispora eburnea]|uniref:RING-type E3 ubiquitin transferase n=1 Tax=Diversispora eburnea TaxID=1213867 RepID=A0A9N8Z3I0_9GLOM|nr:1489_t:CDS:1 [Diversispora eburnea]
MFIYIATPAEAANDKLKIQCGPTDDIKIIRELIFKHFGKKFSPKCQRLIFGGKQLEDGHTLFHYNIKNTNTVQLFGKINRDLEKVLPDASPGEQHVVSVVIHQQKTDANDVNEMDLDAPQIEDTIQESVASVNDDARKETVELDRDINMQDSVNDGAEDYVCEMCNNNSRKKCKNCGCSICGGKDDEAHMIVCDECQYYFHFACLNPPLTNLPDEEYWYCPDCKHQDNDIVLAGQRLDLKKSKKSKMPSAFQTKSWGGGMACVGLSKRCEIVDPDYFGAIPGIPVGSSWKYRINCSEAGVHRPPVAGIAGKSSVGSVSIVLSGGYPEDTDNGSEFIYTGSGGRDLKTGNKRTAEQSSDQELTKTNLALAVCCDAKVNDIKGAVAKDWKKGKPIRVCRSDKLKKHNPKFAPDEGIRYDGLYKVVRYWPEKGKSGFIVWRYEMRRDDDEPAPWSPEGKKRIAELGLTMYVPDELKDEESKKRKSGEGGSSNKKAKKTKTYKPSSTLAKLIAKDKKNARAWKIVMGKDCDTLAEFISSIEEEFKCPVCIELVQNPVTTPCSHNYCFGCLELSAQNFGKKCVQCREEFGSKIFGINDDLVAALQEVIPTYNQKGKGKVY